MKAKKLEHNTILLRRICLYSRVNFLHVIYVITTGLKFNNTWDIYFVVLVAQKLQCYFGITSKSLRHRFSWPAGSDSWLYFEASD